MVRDALKVRTLVDGDKEQILPIAIERYGLFRDGHGGYDRNVLDLSSGALKEREPVEFVWPMM